MTRSLLATDGYKFSMAESGWPLREETFYYSHRRGGPHYLPFDVKKLLLSLLPSKASDTDFSFLAANNYRMGGGYHHAMAQVDHLQIRAIPSGSWFFDREPVFSVTGPSALVSWLEPLALQLQYRIQVATKAKLEPEPERLSEWVGTVNCEAQRAIVLETLDAIGIKAPQIQVQPEPYIDAVRQRIQKLIEIVEDPRRIFEVGLRAATCMEQHELALIAARDAGVKATSNVFLAQKLGLTPVGTMGHEHVQRYGSDRAAFEAMRDRFPGGSSFLLDTFDTVRSGLPVALKLISENPTRQDAIRFDSGDKRTQYLIAASLAQNAGIRPRYILEDGFNLEMTRSFETLRTFVGVKPLEQFYGYGGHIVNADENPLPRDRVGAVYKLSQSGSRATMKFGDEADAGKESIPGRPVLYRPYLGSADHRGPNGIVSQEGESPPANCIKLTDAQSVPTALRFTVQEIRRLNKHPRPRYSPETEAHVQALYQKRKEAIREV